MTNSAHCCLPNSSFGGVFENWLVLLFVIRWFGKYIFRYNLANGRTNYCNYCLNTLFYFVLNNFFWSLKLFEIY